MQIILTNGAESGIVWLSGKGAGFWIQRPFYVEAAGFAALLRDNCLAVKKERKVREQRIYTRIFCTKISGKIQKTITVLSRLYNFFLQSAPNN